MGATYTRQSSSGITDGSVIEASDINAEFDQLLAAFVAASGHTHDGTAAEGGPVTALLGTAITIGNATAGTDIAVTFDGESADGVLTWMEDEDYFKFSDDILMATTEKFQLRDTAIYLYSSADGQGDLVADSVLQVTAPTVNIEASTAITLESDAITLGEGGNTDIALTFNATTYDGVLTWMEDEDYFKFSDDILMATTEKVQFRDTALSISSSTDGQLDIDADTEVEIATTTLDLNAALDVSGASQFSSTITVGVDDTGYDVKLFGASAGAFALWNETSNLLDLRGATAAGPGHLKLTTGELTVVDADILGRIDFQAPLESDSSDSRLVAASIYAEADDTFSASVNNTDIVFATGKTATASEKFRFTADNEIGIAGANYGTDGQVLTSGGAGAAVAWESASGAITALNNATVNEIVTVGSTTTQLDAESNFTYDGNDAALTSSTSNKPIISITNTNTDANGSILKFIKDAGEAGAANDISGLISFYADDAGQNNQEFGRITGRVVDATAGGEEGALDFYVAEYDGTVTKGMEIKGLASDGNITVDISTHDETAGGLMLGGTLVTSSAAELNILDTVTSTATELNLMDGGTTAGTTAVASGDGIVTNDGGTMRQTTTATFDTYLSASTKTLTNKTLTAPKFADAGFIADASGNELIILQTTGTAVNQFDVANAATGNDPTITATGGDSDVGLGIVAKGSGVIQITSTMNPTISSTGKVMVLGF